MSALAAETDITKTKFEEGHWYCINYPDNIVQYLGDANFVKKGYEKYHAREKPWASELGIRLRGRMSGPVFGEYIMPRSGLKSVREALRIEVLLARGEFPANDYEKKYLEKELQKREERIRKAEKEFGDKYGPGAVWRDARDRYKPQHPSLNF